jgi:predicted nucleic acid-binding protein
MALKFDDTDLCVADSSGIISLLNEADRNHAATVAAAKRVDRPNVTIIVPYDVYAETLNFLGKRDGHAKAVAVAEYLAASPSFLVEDSMEFARRAALRNFAEQPQSVSYTDCVVMAIADEHSTQVIFGFDEAFRKNGYQIIDRAETA